MPFLEPLLPLAFLPRGVGPTSTYGPRRQLVAAAAVGSLPSAATTIAIAAGDRRVLCDGLGDGLGVARRSRVTRSRQQRIFQPEASGGDGGCGGLRGSFLCAAPRRATPTPPSPERAAQRRAGRRARAGTLNAGQSCPPCTCPSPRCRAPQPLHALAHLRAVARLSREQARLLVPSGVAA
jgi:hypothetical protein